MLTIFYDSKCPLCTKEMLSLKRQDRNNQLHLVDLHNDNVAEQYPSINVVQAIKILHGLESGKLLLGLEVTHRAWTIVGKGYWVAPLNWPIIKPVAQRAYMLFARHRQKISNVVSTIFRLEKNSCDSGSCYDK